MTFTVICFLISVALVIYFGVKQRRFKVSSAPPASRPDLSAAETQARTRLVMWLSISCSCALYAGAIVLMQITHFH
jgi:hypothetical protein